MVKRINFNKGALSFFIPKGVMNYRDNKFVSLIDYSSEDGTLKIVKDKDNGLKVFYRYKNNGSCDLKANAEDLDDDKEHEVAVSWSMEDRLVKIYIDGVEIASCEIDITPSAVI
ncbi:hypothetical protein CMI41_03745 [Candidatus Pacearchaeota archaeon]|nr:hypothetical protein [Candidatus Pacearchaeota archaeon]|tara:strand:- start:4700 stop:5041 length:342 start_codon:yes stop_codon:yes gene_type:complete